ncbi:unnamed protein product [Acanthoscelides obtectus]|nr:unnamed protein product [Acanthoscelides obtectus]CAK1648781.1 hypothetical protein AOBTE_LOCUS15870 [Acanthoscelides obtectus]
MCIRLSQPVKTASSATPCVRTGVRSLGCMPARCHLLHPSSTETKENHSVISIWPMFCATNCVINSHVTNLITLITV